MRVRELLEAPGLRLRLLAGRDGLEREIRHVYTTDLPDPSRYVRSGELVLSGLLWCRCPADAERFVVALSRAGAVALGAGEAIGPVPGAVTQACGRHGLTLLAVPPETSFGAVTDEVSRRIGGSAAGLRRRLADEIVTQLTSGGEVVSLLRTAGLPPDGTFLAVALGGISRDAAEELLGLRAVVAPSGSEVVAIAADATDAPSFAEWLRSRRSVNGPGASGTGMSGPGTNGAGTNGTGTDGAGTSGARGSGVTLTAGVSAVTEGCGGLASALREASSARRLAVLRATSGTDTGPVVVATSAEADSHELLLASVAAPVLRTFRDRLLGPVTDYDERHHAELLPTLRAFLDCDGSWNACAAKLYVHVNTVRYRISRIEELTGRKLSSLPDRVDFFLALRSLIGVTHAILRWLGVSHKGCTTAEPQVPPSQGAIRGRRTGRRCVRRS
jgi:hypothetical protein